jgi:RHS repeat-associated protein
MMRGDRHFVYDACGNRTEERRGTGQGLVTRYAYDDAHRLVRVVHSKGDTSTYHYDALGRRIAKRTSKGEIRFVYDGPRLFSELTRETARTYIFEPGGFRPLARVDQIGAAGCNIYYYQLDHLGTPQELTDIQGRVVWSARYRAYGALALKAIELIDNPLRFQGQYFDDETRLHYNLHRYYDPETGGFLTQDPIGLEGGVRLYEYVPNPLGWVDPWGLACKQGEQANSSVTTSRKAALRQQKAALGIPRSQQPSRTWTVHDPGNVKGPGIRDSNPRNQGRIYEYEVVKSGGSTQRVYIADHHIDPHHVGIGHVHTGVPKPGATTVEPGGRYTEIGELITYGKR